MAYRGEDPADSGGESPSDYLGPGIGLVKYFERYIALEGKLRESAFRNIGTEIKRLWDQFASTQLAVKEFKENSVLKFATQNEWRDALDDTQKRMATQDSVIALEKSQTARVDAVEKGLEARIASQADSLGARVAALEKIQFAAQGRGEGQTESKSESERSRAEKSRDQSRMIAICGFLLALLMFILKFWPVTVVAAAKP